MDREIGRVGASAAAETEDVARAQAMEQCRKSATANCVVDLTYSNGCVAIGWPSEGGIVVHHVDAELEKAKAGALKKCTETNQAACEITYEECSLPIFERFSY